jgi:hypothetical protein
MSDLVPSIQKILYFYLVFSIALLVTLFFKPYQVSALFKRRSVYMPLTIAIMALIFMFFRSTYAEYSANYKSLPDGVLHDHKSIQYLEWAKNRNKLERDGYLSLSCLLSQVFLVTVSHWIQKFRAFEEYKARNDKSE